MKIGLISDTHLASGGLPQAILKAFQGVDMILHAGDLVSLEVLRRLEPIAPVRAVQGNMDLPGVRLNLPAKTVVEAEGRRIGLIHGHGVPHPNRVLAPPIDFEAMHRYLLSEFPDKRAVPHTGVAPHTGVDCIIYGHTHQAHIETYQGVLMINPGAATRGQASLGLLSVGQDGIHAEIIQLT
jgi:putative phosphoesterase